MMKRILTLALALILCISLISCSNVGHAAKDEALPSDPGYYSPEIPMDEDINYSEGYGKDDWNSATTAPGEPLPGGTAVGDAQAMSEKIIRTITIDAQTKEYDKAIDSIHAAMTVAGGFEESFRSTGKNYYANNVYSRYAYMVLRIPADQLNAFLDSVGGTVNVLSQNASANNVTGEYYDIESRIRVLEGERAAYEEMLKQSLDIDYLLKVKDRLYNVIEEIESYQTRLKLLDSKVSYSTVTISLSEVVEYTPVVYTEPTFGERVKDAFLTSWQDFADGAQNTAVWFVEAFPSLLVFAVILLAAALIIVRTVRKRKKKAVPIAEQAQEKKN